MDRADEFSLFKTYLDERFGKMQELISTSSGNVEPKIKKEKFEYRYKSNKIQGELNEELLGMITKAKTLVQSGSMKRTAEVLTEAEQKINKRIKLIKIADKSPGGWDTVYEYEPERLGSDSDDDKKMQWKKRR